MVEEADQFRRAERRIRSVLFGDGMSAPGKLKGEEAREEVLRDLRIMREAFAASVARSAEVQAATAEAGVPDLEADLRKIAGSRARAVSKPKPARKTSTKRAPKKAKAAKPARARRTR